MRKLAAIVFTVAASSSLAQLPDSLGHPLTGVEVRDVFITPERWGSMQTIETDSFVWAADEDLTDLLMNNTGVFVRSNGAGGIGSISMRGTSSYHTKVYWNGLSIQAPTLGQVDANVLSAGSFDEVEVDYGAAGLEYGIGGLGGTVNLSSRPKEDTAFHLNGLLSYGSFNTASMLIDADVPLSEKLFLNIGAGGDVSSNDYVSRGDYRRIFGNMAIAFVPSDKTRVDLKAYITDNERQIAPSLLEPQDKEQQFYDQMLMSIASVESDFLRSRIFASTGIVKSINEFTNEGVESVTDFLSWQSNFRQKWTEVWFGSLNLEWGAQVIRDFATSDGYGGKQQQWRNGVYGSMVLKLLPGLTFNAMLRQDVQDTLSSPLLGAASLQYEHAKWGGYSIEASRNYRFPTMNDRFWQNAANPDLMPEEAITFEANAYRDFTIAEKLLVQLRVSAFSSTVQNWIQWYPDGSVWRPVNYKEVLSQGIEPSIRMKAIFGDVRINGNLNYTYVVSKTTDVYIPGEPVGTDLIYTPRHRLSGTLSADFRRWRFGYRQGYTGRYYLSTDNYGYMPSYSTADVKLGYMFYNKDGKKLTARVQVRNLWNWEYQVVPYRPEAPRNVHLQLVYNL